MATFKQTNIHTRVQCSPTSVGLAQARPNYFSIFYLHTGAIPYYNAYFGQGIGIVHLMSVQCTGTELQLLSCSHHSPYYYSYYCRRHTKDAGVRCQGMSCVYAVQRLVSINWYHLFF